MVKRKKEKLIHAITFFVKNTNYCYRLKLFKLLYFFDFEHFKKTGRSVTGLKYFAWPMGPVPNDLYEKIKNPSQNEFKKFFNLVQEAFVDSDFKDKVYKIIPKVKFDRDLFSKREIEIMDNLIYLYKDIKSKDMTEISHDRNGPWYKVFKSENKRQALIPYEYILDDSNESISKEEAKEKAQEDQEMQKMFA